MKNQKTLIFILCVIFSGLILHLFPIDETKVARSRLERLWRQDKTPIRQTILSQCNIISTKQETRFERLFLGWIGNLETKTVLPKKCHLFVYSSRNRLFMLKTLWVISVRVYSDKGPEILTKEYQLETPRPLCFLPLIAFLLALLFEIRSFGLAVLIPSYLFFVSGANLIHMTNLIYKSSIRAVTHEQRFFGIVLIVLWLAFLRVRSSGRQKPQVESSPVERVVNRIMATVTGLWNPVFFTLLGRFLFPKKGRWLTTFLDTQIIIFAASLYLFQLGFGSLRENITENVLLPRYFTFALMAYFATNYWLNPQGRLRVLWGLPNIWRAALFVIGFEVARSFFPSHLTFPLVTRIGLALVLSEIVWPIGISLKAVAKTFLPWVGVVFLSSFVAVLTYETGIIDLALTLFNPRIHPRFLLVFTFLAGIGIGFLTGSFSLAFFTLFAYLQSPQLALLKAGLLDGLIAGCLLSPFSLFNLIPAVQFKLTVRQIVAFRFRQLALPLFVGFLIYVLGALNSIAIIRPATFVFCCLVALAYQLKRRAWSLRRNRALLAPQGTG